MMKDLFSGSLGKLNLHGGSRMFTTPNTVLVPSEYEVDIGKHGDFVTCSLDGRLWVFKDKIIALKWNEETSRMEFSTSRSFNNDTFIQRGLDWILTAKYIIQYNNGKILVEAHKITSLQPMERFYSMLPAIDGFQIIKGYLFRKPGAKHTDLIYLLNSDFNFLVPNDDEIWGKNSDYAGKISLYKNDSEYQIKIPQTYKFTGNNITGISFVGNKLYGFQADGNNKCLCYASQNLNLYSFDYAGWETLSGNTGKIYFDVFNKKAVALHDKGMEFLPDRKKVECDALEQWIAPNKELHYVSNNIIISAFSDKVLATNMSLKYYRSLLEANKELPITATAYNNKKLAIGNYFDDESTIKKLNFNTLDISLFYECEPYDLEFELLNVFEHDILYWQERQERTLIFLEDITTYFHVKGYAQPTWYLIDKDSSNYWLSVDPDEVGFSLSAIPDWWYQETNYDTIMTEQEYQKLLDDLSSIVLYETSPRGDKLAGVYDREKLIYTLKTELVKKEVNYFYITDTGQYIDNEITFTQEPYEYTVNSNLNLMFSDEYEHQNEYERLNYYKSDYVGYVDTMIDKYSVIFYSPLSFASYGVSLAKEYVFDEKYQKLILNSYKSKEIDFYISNKMNEFIHVLYFQLEEIKNDDSPVKCLFFVFRSKIKTRSKL